MSGTGKAAKKGVMLEGVELNKCAKSIRIDKTK